MCGESFRLAKEPRHEALLVWVGCWVGVRVSGCLVDYASSVGGTETDLTMSELAYQEFLALPVGALFTSTAEWGERDAFIKVDAERYRRTYDYITWEAAWWDGAPGEFVTGRGGNKADSWPGVVTMVEVPKWISHAPPLTDEQCREHEASDRKRVDAYVKATGEMPGMGFW